MIWLLLGMKDPNQLSMVWLDLVYPDGQNGKVNGKEVALKNE
jgi:hypothetical protein